MPAPPPRAEPIVFKPIEEVQDVAQKAAIIFIHGLGDQGEGLSNIAEQFQNHKKLPHVQWVFPSAEYNMDAMTAAWYTPTGLSPFPSQRPELDDPEDEAGMMKSMRYLLSLVDDLVSQGVPLNRIVVGGFSQGCAMSLLIGLTSRYAGQLAGILGLAGYLPLADKIEELRAAQRLPEKIASMPTFLGRGTQDMLVPRRYFGIMEKRLTELGLKPEQVERHEYEGAGHGLTPTMIRDFCAWLEDRLPWA